MITKNAIAIALMAVVAVLLTVGGCGSGVRVGELQTESQTVE